MKHERRDLHSHLYQNQTDKSSRTKRGRGSKGGIPSPEPLRGYNPLSSFRGEAPGEREGIACVFISYPL